MSREFFIVIQSEAKNLNTSTLRIQILPPSRRLNDNRQYKGGDFANYL